MTLLETAELLDLIVKASIRAGIDFTQYNTLRAKAAAEGREELSVDELRLLSADAQAAIDAIGTRP